MLFTLSTLGVAYHTQPQVPIVQNPHSMPSMKELLYPAKVPTFEKLAEEKHTDQRALIYTISKLDRGRKRPFSDEEICYKDFEKKGNAYSALKKAGLIRPLDINEELETRFTRNELAALAREQGLHNSGTKQVLANRLAGSGYKIDRRKYRGRLFRLTELGLDAVTICSSDRQAAITCATVALKEADYKGAITAYREYDSKWGFVHTSGKIHTVFACYDIPCSQFLFIENYPMRELRNTENFKRTLRACLLAGFMRGCQERWELTCEFKEICNEEINCPRLLSLFNYEPVVLENMRQQVEYSSDNALEYYISHLLYLSRK